MTADERDMLQCVQVCMRHPSSASAGGMWMSPMGPSSRRLSSQSTRKAFTNEALLHKLAQEPAEKRVRSGKRRDEGWRVDRDPLARIELDLHDMRNLIFAAFQRQFGG